MKNWTFALIGILTLTCCEQSKTDSLLADNHSFSSNTAKNLNNKEIPESLLELETQSRAETTQENIDENLFGKFFCDRAEFYIIKNPQYEIYYAKPESITLYYLDGKLLQTKYILSNDIATNLIRNLGNFKITGLDSKNREIITHSNVIVKTEKGIILNAELNNYEIKWAFGEKEISYRVNAGLNDKFFYIEKVKDYNKEFKAIEKYCI